MSEAEVVVFDPVARGGEMGTEHVVKAIRANRVKDGVAGLSVFTADTLEHIAWWRIHNGKVMLSTIDRLTAHEFELYQVPNDPGHFIVQVEDDDLDRIALLRSCFDEPIVKAKLLASMAGSVNSEDGRKEQR